MTTFRRRARHGLGIVLAAVLLAAAAPAPAAAAQGHTINVAERADFVAQTNFVQCVGASMQMMLNMIEPGRDGSAATQRTLQDLARTWSGTRPDGRERQGASVRGWAAGLNVLGAGPYRLVGEATLQAALQTAAQAIAGTGKPVGLLVWRGRHAWVMSGFTATADPRSTTDFTVTRAIVYDPLYPHGSSIWGSSPRPGAALTPEQVGRQFVPRRMSSWPGGGTGMLQSALGGKYVLVLPYNVDLTVRAARVR